MTVSTSSSKAERSPCLVARERLGGPADQRLASGCTAIMRRPLPLPRPGSVEEAPHPLRPPARWTRRVSPVGSRRASAAASSPASTGAANDVPLHTPKPERSRRGRAPCAISPGALTDGVGSARPSVVGHRQRADQRGAGPEVAHPRAVVAEQRDGAVGVEGARRRSPGRLAGRRDPAAGVRREGRGVDRPAVASLPAETTTATPYPPSSRTGRAAGRRRPRPPAARGSSRATSHDVDRLVAVDTLAGQDLAQRQQLQAREQVGLGDLPSLPKSGMSRISASGHACRTSPAMNVPWPASCASSPDQLVGHSAALPRRQRVDADADAAHLDVVPHEVRSSQGCSPIAGVQHGHDGSRHRRRRAAYDGVGAQPASHRLTTAPARRARTPATRRGSPCDGMADS